MSESDSQITRPPFDLFIIESPGMEDLYFVETNGDVLSRALALSGTRVVHRVAGTRVLLERALGEFHALLSRSAIAPFLHIHGHSEGNGLALTSGEWIEWSEMGNMVGNEKTGSLTVAVASCWGFNAARMAMSAVRSFGAIVGPKDKVKISDATVGFAAFYHRLFRDLYSSRFDLDVAVEVLRVASGEPSFDWVLGDHAKSFFMNELKLRISEVLRMAREIEECESETETETE